MNHILSIDVGTTAFKIGVFDQDLTPICETARSYEIHLYDQGKADIDPEQWWQALKSCCHEMQAHLSNVTIISLSVTTPGLLPMDQHGQSLGPAILFCDQRSQEQARMIRQQVGEDAFVQEACNLPVSGGSSLCSMLWIKDNQPDIWNSTYKFGHTNTYMVHQLTGQWIIDPSTTSITGLYHTRLNQLTYWDEVLKYSQIPADKLPPLMHSHQKAGTILPNVAKALHIPEGATVLCGGNDAVLAGLSAGLKAPGDIVDIAGTCEIIAVCTDRPIGSADYNIRCHVLPGRWVTFFVLNTGGKALAWFHSVFCCDMTSDEFYQTFVPETIEYYLSRQAHLNDSIPQYEPFLQGSRYSLDKLCASFQGLNLETDRRLMLLGLLRGNLSYLSSHLQTVSQFIDLKKTIITTGGGAKIAGMNALKKHWLGDFEYTYQDQSSLVGAAMLGILHLNEK